MKNILVIHQSAELYGSDKMLLTLLSRIDRAVFNPIVILPGEGPLKEEFEKLGIRVFIAPVLKLYRDMFTPAKLLNFVKGYRQTMKILGKLHNEYKFDLVYSNTLAVLSGMLFARKKRLKHVWHVHEIIEHPKMIANGFAWLLNRYANTVICISYACKDNLTKRQAGLEKKCVIIHNGLQTEGEGMALTNQKEIFGFAPNDIVVTLVGRISRFKGHKWLMSSYIGYLRDTGIKLFIVGSTVPGQEFYLHELEEMIKDHQLENKVILLPFTKNMKAVWAATDIGVVPSTEPEPFGLVALEAMLAQKPVVASNHGGLTEIVVDNETGYLVHPGNEELLANAIKKLAYDEVLRAKLGNNGQERAFSHFSVTNYVAQISKILDA
ncbi:glycosyltransferase family 4 protein [Flavobacterium sp. MFBS3-15]|uniref:glycosyltransferase family 4 protein n=1 Tax=Flavobacterium sp. MFBS3-15 TaxID=2989816 RepID=UPI002235D0F2|nr:glycosyltransferase family 4 protein [Flavobacterium sp. MFBS3-15]MCW4469156.1 glycosyltransferase family 4 protein [Flavobacterium sp. MFBS3-15]